MSFGLNPAAIKRGESIKAKFIKNNVQMQPQSTTNTVSSRLQQLNKQNKTMLTGQTFQTKYLQQYKKRQEEDRLKHLGKPQLRFNNHSTQQTVLIDARTVYHQPEPLKDYQKETSSPSDRNQPKIQQSDSILVYYLKRIVDHKDILANQICDNAQSEYLNPIIRMTNIVKVIEKINYEKVDVTNIIKTAYLTKQGRQMLRQYSQLKYGQQQRTPEILKISINESEQQLKDLQQIIQNKKKEANNLQYTLNAYNKQLKSAEAQLRHYKSEIAHNKKTNQELQNLTDTLRKESKKEQQGKEEIIKQRIKQQTQHKRISLLKDSTKKECQKYEQLRDKAKKEWLQYQTLSDSLSKQCKQLKMKIEEIQKVIDRDGVKLAENRSLAQALKDKEALCVKLQKENEQLIENIRKDELFVKSVNSQLDALSQDVRNKEQQIAYLKQQLKCKAQQVREAKVDAYKATTQRDNNIKQSKAQNKSLSQELKQKQHEIKLHIDTKEQWQKNQSELHDKLHNSGEEVKRLRLVIDDFNREKGSLQERIRKAASRATDKESVINGIQQEQKRKQETIDTLQKENTVLNEQIKNKQMQLRDTSEKSAELHAAFQKLVVQHKALEEKVFARDKIIDNLTQNQIALQDKLNALQIQYSDQSQQVTVLTHQRDSLKEKLQKVQTDQKTRLISIQTELTNKQEQLNQIAKRKSQFEQKIGSLEEQIKVLSDYKEKQIKTIQQKDKLINALQTKNEQNDQSLKSFRKQHQEVEHTLKKSIKDLEVSVQDYQTKMKSSDQAILALQNKHKQQLNNMEQKAQAHSIKKISEFQGGMDKLTNQNEQLTKQIDELQSQNKQLEEQLRKTKEARDQMIKVQSTVPSSAEVQTCVVLEPQFSNRTQGIQRQIVQTKEQGVECHNNDELEKALEKIKRLQIEIKEKQEQINEMRTMIDEERSQMDALNSMIKESNQQEQPAQPTEEDIKRQPSQGKDLAKKLQQKEKQLNDLIEGTQQLNINYNELLQEHQKLEQEHNKLKDEYKKLKQQPKYVVEKKPQVPSITLKELEKVKTELQQQLRKQSADQLKEMQEKHIQEIRQLEEKHKAEKPEKPKDSKNQIKALKIQIQALQKQYNDLSQQNQSLKGNMKNMQIVAYHDNPHRSSDRQQRHLFHGQVLRTSDDYKLFIKRQIQSHMAFRIVDTRLLYRFDAYNTVNIHKYIDMIPHLVFLVKLNNGNYIATYYEGVFKSKSTADKEGILMALNQGKCYYPNQPNRRAIIYDDYFIIFGNSEVRIKTQDKKVFSNFGLSSNYYKNNGDKVPIMLGGSDSQRQIEFEHFEVFQLIIGK